MPEDKQVSLEVLISVPYLIEVKISEQHLTLEQVSTQDLIAIGTYSVKISKDKSIVFEKLQDSIEIEQDDILREEQVMVNLVIQELGEVVRENSNDLPG